MQPRVIRLMADYGCWPLWEEGGVNLDPAGLPIDQDLKSDLDGWARRFDELLKWDDPAGTFVDPDEDADFEAEGRRLAGRLRIALGDAWVVVRTG